MEKSSYPNFRTWEPTDSQAKNVMDTKMLATQARETPDTVDGTNDNQELVNGTPAFGELGAKGRC